jgi:hypothetical protein
MLFEALFWHGFKGTARLTEEGLSAIVQSRSGTATLAFSIDNEHVREALGLTGGLCCDGLFLSVRGVDGKEPEVALLFVELKGKHITHATKQLETAIAALREKLAFAKGSHEYGRTRFRAAIVSARGASELVDMGTRRAFKKQEVQLEVFAAQRGRKPVDLTEFLWSEARGPAGS